MRHAAVIIVHRRLTRRRAAYHVINHDQSARSIARCHWQPAADVTLVASASSSRLATHYKLFPVCTMTSQAVCDDCDSVQSGCSLLDGKSCSEQFRSTVSVEGCGLHATVQSHGRTSDSTPPGQPVYSTCTPHSIDDILSRPRRDHVTSLLLPESRGTAHGRLYPWSSDDVQRLARRAREEDGLTWKSMYWSQHSPRLAATTPTKRGIIIIIYLFIYLFFALRSKDPRAKNKV